MTNAFKVAAAMTGGMADNCSEAEDGSSHAEQICVKEHIQRSSDEQTLAKRSNALLARHSMRT